MALSAASAAALASLVFLLKLQDYLLELGLGRLGIGSQAILQGLQLLDDLLVATSGVLLLFHG